MQRRQLADLMLRFHSMNSQELKKTVIMLTTDRDRIACRPDVVRNIMKNGEQLYNDHIEYDKQRISDWLYLIAGPIFWMIRLGEPPRINRESFYACKKIYKEYKD